ncbi:MAG: TAXI family TRAP transporter solute-binding subunit [Acidobacteria bacterium]|nr:TAXI family TRAP transporter solute-binding subunit [Acidobacteriota bacterium]
MKFHNTSGSALHIFCLLLLGATFGCQAKSTEKITLSGGSLSGAWSAISEGVSTSLRRQMPGVAVTHEVGMDGANAVLVDSGRVQLGVLHSAMGKLARAGESPYPRKLDGLRAITRVYSDSAFHFVVSPQSGITSIEEIRDRQYPLRWSVNSRGTFMEISSKTALEAYGITYQDIESWGGKVYFRAQRPSLELMQDGGMDAISNPVQFPETTLNEVSLRTDLRLLSLSDQAIAYINEKLGTYSCTIPANTYRFAPQEIRTFCDVAILIVDGDLEEQKVYDITRALFNSLDYLHTVHRALSKLQPADMPRVGALPLHPGAERFYREAGVL